MKILLKHFLLLVFNSPEDFFVAHFVQWKIILEILFCKHTFVTLILIITVNFDILYFHSFL